jgi:hypothetical protein
MPRVENPQIQRREDMNRMQTHVKVLAILHIVFGALGVLAGIIVFAVMGGVAGMIHMNHDADAANVIPMLGGIGAIVMVFLLCASIPGIIGGIGLLSYRPWARILIIVISALELISIPIGTAVGIYGLWVLLTKDGAQLFEQQTPVVSPSH